MYVKMVVRITMATVAGEHHGCYVVMVIVIVIDYN